MEAVYGAINRHLLASPQSSALYVPPPCAVALSTTRRELPANMVTSFPFIFPHGQLDLTDDLPPGIHIFTSWCGTTQYPFVLPLGTLE